MISTQNNPLYNDFDDNDFTFDHYIQLLRLAKENYEIADYKQIPWDKKFILWRHDLDFSLNRGLALAKSENSVGVKATYFINPHSEFYNIAEAGQHKIIKEIISLGHDIGLHFDAAFFNILAKEELNYLIEKEASYLEWLFGVKPTAFSFHNPSEENLKYENDEYGGLVNCYSKRFKKEVPYCSDSNGYWRFRRLCDVLNEAKNPCLQVLTHPGWWQDKPVPPRQRIFRSVYGRASATMQFYDRELEQHNRLNHIGNSSMLAVLKESRPAQFEVCDYLWNRGEFQTLFAELWRLHEAQINNLCLAELLESWRIPANEVKNFLSEKVRAIDSSLLFECIFKKPWTDIVDIALEGYINSMQMYDQVVRGRSYFSNNQLEEGCIFICSVIKKLSEWGKKQPLEYDGLANLSQIELNTNKIAQEKFAETLETGSTTIPKKMINRWAELKLKF